MIEDAYGYLIDNSDDNESFVIVAENQTWDARTIQELKEKYLTFFLANGEYGIPVMITTDTPSNNTLLVFGHEDDGRIVFPRKNARWLNAISVFNASGTIANIAAAANACKRYRKNKQELGNPKYMLLSSYNGDLSIQIFPSLKIAQDWMQNQLYQQFAKHHHTIATAQLQTAWEECLAQNDNVNAPKDADTCACAEMEAWSNFNGKPYNWRILPLYPELQTMSTRTAPIIPTKYIVERRNDHAFTSETHHFDNAEDLNKWISTLWPMERHELVSKRIMTIIKIIDGQYPVKIFDALTDDPNNPTDISKLKTYLGG